MSVFVGASLIVFVLIVVILLIKHFFWHGRLQNISGKHVVVTGGSSGIGKCVAILAAKRGANVTIIARDVNRLEAAKEEILGACKNKDSQRVEYVSLDVGRNYATVEKTLLELERNMGPIYMLVNCAGFAVCGKIEDISPQDMEKMLDINFLGTYYCIKAVVPRMKTAKEGIIILVSSQAAFLGIFGYSAYCSTKFALRGLAESIAMELKPYNVSVTLGLPPDTDTPGFAVEEATKPLETKLISETGGLFSPEHVADQLLKDALARKFFSTVGMDGFMLTIMCTGMAPFTSLSDLTLQSMLMGLSRFVGACYHIYFQRIIRDSIKTRDKNKKFE